MRKIIVILCLFVVVLFLLTPGISAVKFGTLRKENRLSFFEKINNMNTEKQWGKLTTGLGLLELLIGFLMFLYIELGIIFNRSFTLILLLANILYEIGLRLGLIDTITLVF